MASITAFVIVGSPHPNDSSVTPDTMIELWEGSRATWVVRRLQDGMILRRLYPDSPNEIGNALIEILSSMTPDKRLGGSQIVDMSVVVAPLPGSSMNLHLGALTDVSVCDVHILETVFSRTMSAWTGEWTVHDRRHLLTSETAYDS